MAILNYTTTINSIKTIGEITQALVERGANKIVVDYKESFPIALTFTMNHKGQQMFFELPANINGVQNVLIKQNVPKKYQTREQAIRTSWRIIKVWVDAQMAIIDAEIVTPAQVFLPYAITKNGKPLYSEIENTGILQLEEVI